MNDSFALLLDRLSPFQLCGLVSSLRTCFIFASSFHLCGLVSCLRARFIFAGSFHLCELVSSLRARFIFANSFHLRGLADKSFTHALALLPFRRLQIRIDHRNGTLHFGSQQLESEKIRSHLSLLASHLSKAVNMIDPSVSAEKAAKRTAAIQVGLACQDGGLRKA